MHTFSASEISIAVPLLSVAVMLSTVPPCVYTVIGVPGAALLTSVHACPVPVLSIVIGYSVPSVVTASQKRSVSSAVEFLSLVDFLKESTSH